MALPQTYIDTADEPLAQKSPAPLRLLWLVAFDYRADIAHGGNLRLFNYGKELLAKGHEVHLIALKTGQCEESERRAFVNELKRRRIVSECFEVEYQHPWLRGKIAHLLAYPGLANFFLRKQQTPVVQAVQEIIATHNIDVCVVSCRDLLFVVPKINTQVKTVIDWVDSYFLYHLREARMHLKQFRIGRALRALKLMTEAYVRESYFGRRATANISVSPVDKKYLDFANSAPEKNRVLPNGVMEITTKPVSKIKGRLIFTGNMDFPPNYESALWFIDNVFPLLQQRWETRLVIAGANPVKELQSRANERIEVTGYVVDIQKEIARSELYVAPLICGGGFKNKVVEAIASGTFVIGTSLATEFLAAETRRYIPTAESPHELAEVILNYLDEPKRFAPNLEALRRIVAEDFSWPVCAEQFVDIIRPDPSGSPINDRGVNSLETIRRDHYV
jgi:glycosyltransferase involved in cell wall biosynthesis